ncbi:MAG: hypothetical protein ABIH23_09300 [bacterium]
MQTKESKSFICSRLLILCMTAGLVNVSFSVDADPVRLNNLVTELAHFTEVPTNQDWSPSFVNPREGWVFISMTADMATGAYVGLALGEEDSADPVLRVSGKGENTGEAMRFLPMGTHRLHLNVKKGDVEVRSVTVRAVPELHYCRYPANPTFAEYGPYDWAFLKKHILHHVNTIVGNPNDEIDSQIEEWIGRGGKWIAYGGLPHDKDLTAQKAYEYWANNPGFQDPRLSGLIADEFQGRQNSWYPSWIEGLKRLSTDERFAGKRFYGYCGGPGMYTRPQTRELVRAMFAAGYYMAWERYHHEMPTLEEAKEFMNSLLGKEMAKWRATFPECQREMVLVLGLFTHGLSLNVRPDVDYKVWIDMQMQYLAVHPEFDGLFGVHFWNSAFADEETLRWMGRLFRHYAIEGNTDLLSSRFGYNYSLEYIKNPDFADELNGWTVEAASEGSVKADYMERYGRLESRYWHRAEFPDEPAGNTFLWTKRSTDRPNKVSQPIMNLKPGETYLVKMITADYGDISNGRSVETKHAVSIAIDGGEVIPEKTFQTMADSSFSAIESGPFNSKNLAWFNHHRIVFRATKSTGRITISDWINRDKPGGPVGQELMYNFIEIQPYFEE